MKILLALFGGAGAFVLTVVFWLADAAFQVYVGLFLLTYFGLLP